MDGLKQGKAITLAVTLSTLAVTGLAYYLYSRKKNWKKVGNVSKLFIHPVKSFKGLDVDQAFCSLSGFHKKGQEAITDRCFLITRPDGKNVGGVLEPKLMMVKVTTGADYIELNAPGMEEIRVSIPGDVKQSECSVYGEKTMGLDCGEEIATWLHKYTGSDYRMVYHSVRITPRTVCGKAKYKELAKKNMGKVFYQNDSPYNLLSEASIADLNTKLETPVSVLNFRPNILIKGNNAYEEHNWRHVMINGIEFEFAKHCNRCLQTTINQDTGVKHPASEPWETLKSYRQCDPEDKKFYGVTPLFGVNLGTHHTGVISVGDEVFAC